MIKKGYNLQSGGDFPQVSETTKEKISKANSGKIFTKEHKNNIFKSRMKMKNKTGIHRVTKVQDKTCLQGFRWVYGYNDGNKRIEISRIDLEDLKNEIISQGLEWVINDEKITKKTLEKDKNKIKLKKTLSEDHKKKLSEIAKVEQYGIKNPQAKYTLWDSSKCYFSKRDLIRSNKDNKNLRKVFLCKYNGYRMPIGYFHEFLSCEIISDIIRKEIEK